MRDVLEKIIVTHLVKKQPTYYGTRILITVLKEPATVP
jgi:hypothetical protein